MKPIYKRIMIKMSGEALSGKDKTGIDFDILSEIADEIKALNDAGVEVAVVIGAGNFWRGRSGVGMDRTTADHMGMLATVINSLAMQDALETKGVPVRVQTAIEMNKIAEPYIRKRAVRHLEKKRVVIFGCGTGNPFFSTDTAAALRAAEIDAEVILFAKNVDGVYDSDPNTNGNAKKYKEITYMDVMRQRLGAMDATATSLCMENNIPAIVFGLNDPNNIIKVVEGEKIGTIIS